MTYAVTSLLTFNFNGGTYLLLTRPDPRYKDSEGRVLAGAELEVPAFRFVGGYVKETPIGEELYQEVASEVIELPRNLPPHVVATACAELLEETGVSLRDHLGKEPHIVHVDTVERKGKTIFYLNTHLGELNRTQFQSLCSTVSPADDVIASLIINTSKLRKNDQGEITIRSADGFYRIKEKFNGFPELETWQFTTPERQQNYTRIHETIRGLEGIDKASLGKYREVGLFTPSDHSIKTDTQILEDCLLRVHGMDLSSQSRGARSR